MSEQPIGIENVYTAQPTVRVNGNVVEQARTLLLGMQVHEQSDGLSRMELRFSNVQSQSDGSASLAFDNADFDFGKQIALYAGDENTPVEIFRGVITAIETEFPEFSEPEFVVLAEDALQKGRFTRKTQFYDAASLRDLLNRLATETGLTLGAAPSNRTGRQMRLNESSLAFLRRIMARYDVEAQASGTDLQSDTRQNIRRSRVTLEMHSQLRRARITADLAHQATELTASGWDAKQGQRVTASSRGRNAGPGAGRTGPAVFENAFGGRSEHLGHLAVATSEEAQALVDSAFDQRARGFVTLHGTAEGNPQIRVGTHLTVNGLGARFNNTYYVRSTLHRFDLKDGYKTDFCAECAFVGTV